VSFLSPALLLGLLAAAIPPLIHLILRRKALVVRFPALEFIRRSNKKTQRRFRMKQLLLMALRSALLALLAFALARPFMNNQDEALATAGDANTITVVVLDATYPMGYRLGDRTLLERARDQAEILLSDGSGLAGLVVAGDTVRAPADEVTGDLAAVRRALGDLAPGHTVGTLPEAVARAYDILADSPQASSKRVVVLTSPRGATSDLPPPPQGSAQPVELVPVDVAEGAPTPNRAVVGVSLRPAPEVGAGQWRVDARVANFSDESLERLPIHLEVGGVVKVRGFLNLGPGEEGTKTFHARLEEAQATPAAVGLEADNLPIDDRRDFWLQPAPRIRVLAVNGDPRPTPQRDELFYLERALAPGTAAGARLQLTITGVDTLDRHPLTEQDVVILANVAELPSGPARALESFVRGGGGLLVTTGDQIEPGAFNARLGGLLPRTLRDVRTAGDAAASEEGGDRRASHPTGFAREHPILQPFADPASSSLGSVRVRRYMLLDPAPDAGGQVVMTLGGGAPLLLTKQVERGRVALLTTSLDRDWTDLPIRADFVPLLQQVVRFLTRVTELDVTPVLVGAPAAIPVDDPRVARVQVQTPDGQLHVAERPVGEGAWVFEGTKVPGHYRLTPDPPLPGLVALPGFAVALDPAGADLRGGPGAGAQANADDGPQVSVGVTRRTELWHAALFALFLLLLGEGAILFKRRAAVAPIAKA
jgi:hypothetical protein